MSQLLLFLFGCFVSGIAALGMLVAAKRALRAAKADARAQAID